VTDHIEDGENEYRHAFSRKCPNNGEAIAYSLTITTERELVMVEEIEAACAGDGAPIFHEALADELIKRFPGRHRLDARHGETDISTARSRIPIMRFG
jgi:hypothetical protein